MQPSEKLKIAVLIDLPRNPRSGGHVKSWERMTAAAANLDLPFDLTTYFSGKETTEILAPHVRIRQLPPIFSTAQLKFLPYVPDHTDLASYHPRLARELTQYDLIQTTDGFFAFAQTAAKISQQYKIPLLNAIHTDTPGYARIFTRQTIEKLLGKGWLGKLLNDGWQMPQRSEQSMLQKLRHHMALSQGVFAFRKEDRELAATAVGEDKVFSLRPGYNAKLVGTHRRDRSGIEQNYNIPPNRLILLFVGRVDIGKNIYVLAEAMEKLIAEGLPLHLITAGVGPAEAEVKQRLGDHVSLAGFVDLQELGRLYASVDGLALSSEVETRSMACAEALVSGCPVLLSAASGVANNYGRIKAMQEVSSGVAAWTDAMRRFAMQPELRDMMRHSALAEAKNYLVSWEDVVAEDLWPIWQKTIAAQHQAA